MPLGLIVKPSSLGDVIHSLPVAAAMADSGYEVHFAVRRAYRPLVELCPAVSKILEFPTVWSDAGTFIRELRSEEYDVVIDLQGLLRSGLSCAAARAARRIGLPDSREGSVFFYDRVAAYPSGVRHAVDRYWSVLREIGVGADTKEFRLKIPDAAFQEAEDLTAASGHIVLSPTTRQARKLWPADRWVDLARRLAARVERVVAVGQGDVSIPGDACVNLIGRTSLPVLCAILSRAKLCVTVDSAPMHLAAALGVPVVALFGPTDPDKVGPYTDRKTVLRAGDQVSNLTVLDVESAIVSGRFRA